MDIKTLAVLLVIEHGVSFFFMGLVLRRQTKLSKLQIDPELVAVRKQLFYMALAIFTINISPLVISALTIFGSVTRSTQHVNIAGLMYTIPTATGVMLASYFIWKMYKLASKVAIIVEHDKEVALDKAS